MCRTMKELERVVADYRSMKAMKEQIDAEVKSLEYEIIGYMDANEKLTAEEQQEIRAYCENNERQAFDVGFKTAVQLWNQLDNTGGIME